MTGRALVTGSAGFVGTHVSRALREHGWDVTEADLTTGRDALHLFATCTTRFDLVVHLAAVVGGRATIDGEPLRLACADLQLDAAFFAWCSRTRPGMVVYPSSSAAYPTELQTAGRRLRLTEGDLSLDWPRAPDATYGWVKLTGEILARHLDLPTLVLRPFSGYGPGQSLDYPWPSFVHRALTRTDPFPIWGSGTQVRDWIHIDDIVAFLLLAAAEQLTGTYNVCTGRGLSMVELATIACTAAGHRPHFSTLPGAPSGVHRRVGDPSLMDTIRPARITVEEGLDRAFAHLRAA